MIRDIIAQGRRREGVTITTSDDPTGNAVEFAAVLPADASPIAAFQAGTFDGAWDPISGEVDTLTPLIGSGQALDITAGNDYELYVRWTAGPEQPIEFVGTIRAL